MTVGKSNPRIDRNVNNKFDSTGSVGLIVGYIGRALTLSTD